MTPKSTSGDDLPLQGFQSADAMGAWLEKHHATSSGFWLLIPKKGGGGEGPTYSAAVDEALRFGWIDSQKKKHDDAYFLQRFTPRRPRSVWSKVNRKKIEALEAQGRMEPAGRLEVQRAKDDGRWDAAYDSFSTATVPPDLHKALAAYPAAAARFAALTSAQRYSFLWRIQTAKKPETRDRRIQVCVDECRKDGESA